MDMIAMARRDAKLFTSSKTGGFAVDVTLIDRAGTEATITALSSKRFLTYDTDRASEINAKLAHIDFSESILIEAAPTYQLRNSEGSVDMLDHTCRWIDSTGVEYRYRIKAWKANETLGMVVCMLEDIVQE